MPSIYFCSASTEIYSLSLHAALPIYNNASLKWLEMARRGSGFRIANPARVRDIRSEEHTSELQSLRHLVCRLFIFVVRARRSTLFPYTPLFRSTITQA